MTFPFRLDILTYGLALPFRRLACTSYRVLSLLLIVLATAASEPVRAGPKDNKSALPSIGVGFVRHAYGTWTGRIADGGFETGTGRTIKWLPYETDSAVAAALAADRIQIGLMGASVVAAAFTRGLDLRIFYVLGGSSDTEALLISGSTQLPFRVGDPKSLRHRVIAAPFGSTAHFRLLQSLKRWGVAPPDVRIVNLQPRQIAGAWMRSEIDAAVVSEPVLSMLNTESRTIPLPSSSGYEGLLVFATMADFLKSHDVFLARFVDVIARADTTFADRSGPLDETQAEIKAIAHITGMSEKSIVEAIARYRPPPLQDLATPRWLGGGATSALAVELKVNAELWKWAGRLDAVAADYAPAITAHAVERALALQR